MRRVLATLVAVLLLMSMFAGVFALVPRARGFASPPPVDLGTAGSFTILAKSGITNVPTSAITGDIGVSPAAASTITGFALVMDGSYQFSTSSQVTGKIYASDYASPTPGNMTTAVSDMEAAYVDATLRTAPNETGLGGGNISGMTLAPGLYKWSTGVLINSNVTLSGNASDVWIFQIAGDLKIASNTKVLLAGGALASNVFWQVGGGAGAILGTYSTFNGNILSLKQIILKTGAVLNGRTLAQTLVTLDHNRVSAFGSAVGEGPVGGLVYPTNKQGIMRQLAALVALLAALCGLVVWSALVLSRRKRRNGTDTGDMQTGDKSGS